jgi:hypothetical protein
MTQSPKHFWKWFEENNKAYLFLNVVDPETKEFLLNNILKQLHRYCDNLWFEIGGHPNDTQELIITCEGDKSYFESVERLVDGAPSMSDWSVIAFIPPREVDFEMKYEDVILKPSEMWFEPMENENSPETIGIKVCIRNYELVRENEWLQPAVYKVLDTILGEKSFALDVEYVEIDQLPDEPDEEGLIELSKLPDYVRWKKSNSKNSDKNGA